MPDSNLMPADTLAAFLMGDIQWKPTGDGGDDFGIIALGGDYTYDEDHAFRSDVTDGVLDEAALSDIAVTDGWADASDVSLTIPSGETMTQAWIYQDTGTPETSRLVLYLARNKGGTAISRPGTGTPFTLRWPTTGIFRLVNR